jgi:eukaryotic-like serine/threonine-protein kinase
MGSVYLATKPALAGFEKLVVLKVLKPELSVQGDFVDMFLREARLTARLSHACIAQTLEVGSEGGCYFIAMEYVEGITAQQLHTSALAESRELSLVQQSTDPTKPSPVPRAEESRRELTVVDPRALEVRVWLDALEGLHHAHEQCSADGTPLALVHRDISPHNVLVAFDGRVKLIDFGIAKASDSEHETQAGVLKGKVRYMAPEQLVGRADRRSDLFSVGVCLWEALSGKRLWEGLSESTVVRRLVSHEVPKLGEWAEARAIPEAFVRLCDKALNADPEARFQTALEMRDAIEDACASAPSFIATDRHLARYVGVSFERQRRERRAAVEAAMARLRAEPTLPRDEQLSPPSRFDTTEGGIPVSVEMPTRRPLLGQVGVALLVVGLGAGAVALFATRNTAQTASVASVAQASRLPTQTESPGPSVALAQGSEAELSVKVSPPTSKVSLDGVVLGHGDRSARIDRAVHRLHVEAPGYAPYDQEVRVEASTTVRVVLAPLAAPGKYGIKARTTATPTSDTSSAPAQVPSHLAAPAATTHKARHDIGREDPYAQ